MKFIGYGYCQTEGDLRDVAALNGVFEQDV